MRFVTLAHCITMISDYFIFLNQHNTYMFSIFKTLNIRNREYFNVPKKNREYFPKMQVFLYLFILTVLMSELNNMPYLLLVGNLVFSCSACHY